MTDFDGVFEGTMPSGAKKNTKKRERPQRQFPKLLELKAVRPEYVKECQNDVTPGSSEFNLKKMNNVGLSLPQGNPCKAIAGTWESKVVSTRVPFIHAQIRSTEWTKHGYAFTERDSGNRVGGVDYERFQQCRNRERA